MTGQNLCVEIYNWEVDDTLPYLFEPSTERLKENWVNHEIPIVALTGWRLTYIIYIIYYTYIIYSI